ncbi:MAG TPA: molecular chaperone DnaJ [Polyangia bacterium]
MTRDYYEILGVDRQSSDGEIKAAYRKLALKFHPDRNPGDRQAEEQFKELSVAYAVLSDGDQRARYDRFGPVDGQAPFGMAADIASATEFFDAIFGDLFGLGRKRTAAGRDLRYTLELDFEEAALGCEKTINFERAEDCGDCRGSGAAGGAAGLIRCDRCNGEGVIRKKAGFLASRRECLACGGTGEVPRVRCKTCEGAGLVDRQRQYRIRIPPGSTGGTTQRVSKEGSPGRRGGPSGDLHIITRVRPHPIYSREGDVLAIEVPVSFVEAALGAEVDVPVLDSAVRMRIPAGTQSGSVFRLRGKGFPLAAGAPRGDAHVRVVVETPVTLPAEAARLLEAVGSLLADETLPRRRAFQQASARATTVAGDAGEKAPRRGRSETG